ncbi:MAG: hydroxymethylglutaryl-CoA lyase [Acidobacteriota bacterium]
MTSLSLPPTVTIVEVGPRDGFQMEAVFIPTDVKIATINAIAAAGVRKTEATSFVNPKVIPQMRDASDVMRGIARRAGATFTALVPNVRGAEQAVAAGVDAVRQVICVTETYNRRNVGMSVDQSVANLAAIRAAAGSTPVELVIALAFGCPLEGPVEPDAVVRLAGRAIEMGIREISIADSIGLAGPEQVGAMMRLLQHTFGGIAWSLHLHDTRGLGLANVLAGLDQGVTTFDASIGGLGGCPVVPGATGNIATEDLVHMLDGMGIATGIDIEALMHATRLAQAELGRAFPAKVLSAGTTSSVFARAATH